MICSSVLYLCIEIDFVEGCTPQRYSLLGARYYLYILGKAQVFLVIKLTYELRDGAHKFLHECPNNNLIVY